MTDFLVWLPFGTVGVVLLILLAVVRFPDEVEPAPPPIAVGAVRVATVIRTPAGVVVDGLVDRLSALGSVGSPVTMVLSAWGTDEASFHRLARWAEADAVIDIALPVRTTPDPVRVVDLRSGSDGAPLRLPILTLSA